MNEHADRDRSEQPPVDLTGWEDGYANAGSPESPHAAGGGHGDPVQGDERLARYVEAVSRSMVQPLGALPPGIARAVMAVADAEQAELRAEVERLRRWKAEATEVILGLQDLGRALGLRPGEQITGRSATEAAMRLAARAEAAEAKVARVEATRHAWSAGPWIGNPVVRDLLAAIGAALAGPESETTERGAK